MVHAYDGLCKTLAALRWQYFEESWTMLKNDGAMSFPVTWRPYATAEASVLLNNALRFETRSMISVLLSLLA